MPRKRGSARRRRRRGSLGPLLRVLSVVLAAVAIVAALTLFFKVDEVQVTGGGRYTEEEIRSASGVEQGDNLILLDKYRIASGSIRRCPTSPRSASTASSRTCCWWRWWRPRRWRPSRGPGPGGW